MKLTKENLKAAQEAAIINESQAEALWTFFNGSAADSEPTETHLKAKFNLLNFVYYFGAFLIIAAMGWFMNQAWNAFSGAGLFAIGLVYIVFFTLVGNYFWAKPEFKQVGGLLYTVAVAVVPLATYGFERMVGIWPGADPGEYTGFHFWIRGGWLLMELATILVGLVYLKYRAFPFLMAPVAFSCWYMSMDIAPLLFGRLEAPSYAERRVVSFIFGCFLTAASLFLDRYTKRSKGDYGFWLCLFGGLLLSTSVNSWLYEHKMVGQYFAVFFNVGMLLAGVFIRRKTFVVLGGIGYLLSFVMLFWQLNEGAKLLMAFAHILVMGLGVLLQRKAFVVLGAIQLFCYLGHLAWSVFKDALLFPIMLTLLGLAAIYLGVLYQRNQREIVQFLTDQLPDTFYNRLMDYLDG